MALSLSSQLLVTVPASAQGDPPEVPTAVPASSLIRDTPTNTINSINAINAVTGPAAPDAPEGTIAPSGSIALSGGTGVGFSPPTLADLNNDGRPEILVGTENGRVFALRYNRSTSKLETMWSHNLSDDLGGTTTIRGAISVGDLDGDGDVEVVASSGSASQDSGGVVALNGSTGQTIWAYKLFDFFNPTANTGPDGIPDGTVSTPALGDLDGDGKLEVAFGGFDFRMTVLNFDGSMKVGWPKFVRDTIWSSAAIADINDDGLNELIIGIDTHQEGSPFNTPNGGGIYVYRYDGQLLPGWPQFINQAIYAAPAVGDLDNDGSLEIVSGTGPYYDNPAAGNKVYVWSKTGQLLWTGDTGGYVTGGPALADLNGDSKLEVLAGALDNRAYAWQSNGRPLWSAAPTNVTGLQSGLGNAPIAMDYDNSGLPEMLINVHWETAILKDVSGAQLTGSFFPGDPKPTYQCTYVIATNGVAVGDITGDGKLDLVQGCADGRGQIGQVYFWSLNTPATFDKAPWPMWGQNARHTRLYPRPTDFAAEVVSHNIPDFMTPDEIRTVRVTLRNTGTSSWRAADTTALGAFPLEDPLHTGSNRVALGSGESVAPGQTKTFSIVLHAPTREGHYTTQWRMLNDRLGRWFGATIRQVIKVGNQPDLQILTTQGIYGAGVAAGPLPNAPGLTDFADSMVWKLSPDKHGYHYLDRIGRFYIGGTAVILPRAGTRTGFRDMALGPDGISHYELLDTGELYGCDPNGCNRHFDPPTPTGIAARSLAITANGTGVYVVDGFGNIYAGGTAKAVAAPSGLPANADIIRRIKLAPGGGYYLMDIHGRVWNGGGAPALVANYALHPNEDWARDFELTEDGKGYYLLSRDNGIHAGGDATPLVMNAPPLSQGDTGRDLELVDARRQAQPPIDFSQLPRKTYLPVSQR